MATTLCPWLDGCVCFRVRADKTVEVRQPTSSIPRTDSLANTHVHFLGKPSGPALLASSDSQLIRTQITASNNTAQPSVNKRQCGTSHRRDVTISSPGFSLVILHQNRCPRILSVCFRISFYQYSIQANGLWRHGQSKGKKTSHSSKYKIQYSKSYCNKTGHQPVQ